MTAFENPYFEEVAGAVTVGSGRASWSERAVDIVRRRDELVEKYAWAIPNEAAIETVAGHGPILEVGAGKGYWARLVDRVGGEIVATDCADKGQAWFGVRLLDAEEAIDLWDSDRALFLCWPPYDEPMAVDALRSYEGDTVIYVGEGRGGCTADDEFHRLLHEEWSLEETVAIPTYLGLHDRLEVWQR